jgi:hypothetical protein
MRNLGYIEVETIEKQCWSYLRNIKPARTISYECFAHYLPIFLIRKIWDVPNTGIFYSKDVASALPQR